MALTMTIATINVNTRSGRLRYMREVRNEKRKGERKLFRSIRKVFRKQRKLVEGAVTRVPTDQATVVTDTIINNTKEEMANAYRRAMLPIMSRRAKQVFRALKGKSTKNEQTVFDSFLFQWVDEHVAKKVTLVSANTKIKLRSQIELGIAAGMSSKEVANLIRMSAPSIFSRSRADTIARTEIHTSSEVANRRAAKSLRIPSLKKQWLSSQDDRTRDAHIEIDGAIVDQDNMFDVPGKTGIVEMEGPGDNNAPADQVINCRCTLIFAKGEE